MRNGIEQIVLTFENCEQMSIPGWMLGDFLLRDFEVEIARYGCNFIGKQHFVNQVLIEISKKFDTAYSEGYSNELTTFQRLNNWHDVAHIDIYYERRFSDDPPIMESYAVAYKEPEDEEGRLGADNVNQKVGFDKMGNLILMISEDGSIQEGFDDLVSREQDEIEFSHEMCDVGEPWTVPVKCTVGMPEDGTRVYVQDKDGFGAFALYRDGEFEYEGEPLKEPYAWSID